MAWPTPQDYNEAVQNPKLAFADPELHVGRPELTPLGLPRPITGGFASVYKLQCPQRTWAVRCFLRQFHDQEQRYAAISQHLTRLRLPYTVGFAFLRDGIRVRGQSYPILKMEWVQGEPLSAFIEKHLGNRSTLLSLATRWVEMVKALQQASIAHGDLQHGNVLVADGQLRLIDYDGMYVPALRGDGSHEVGHRNYQHPLRTESDFGPYLDNFSAWVVYVSLIALAADPGLWGQFGGGDESLLFRRRDFEQPEASDVLRALERHREDRIQSAISLFKPLLYLGPRDVPPLDGQIAPAGFPGTQVPRSGSSWIDDHVKLGGAGAPVRGAPGPAVPPPPDPSWIQELLAPSSGVGARLSFKNSPAPERLVVTVSAAIIAGFIIWIPPLSPVGAGQGLLAILPLVLVNLALWICRYRSDPSVRELPHVSARLRETEHDISATKHKIALANQVKTKLQNQNAADDARRGMEQKATEAREKKETDACEAALLSALSSINARRRTLNQQKAEALRKIQNDIGAKVAALNGQIGALAQAEATELADTLRAQQEQHIAAHLRRFPIRRANLPGYPPANLMSRLVALGFRTAADVKYLTVHCVKGIGPKRYTALTKWRKGIESQARATMPSALPQGEAAAIRAKYEGQRRVLEEQRDRQQRRQRDEEEKIRAQYPPLLALLDKEGNAVKATTQADIAEIRARYEQQYCAIRKGLSKLSDDAASKLRKVDGRIAEAVKTLWSLQWEKEKVRLQLKSYEGIQFSEYVKRVFIRSRKP